MSTVQNRSMPSEYIAELGNYVPRHSSLNSDLVGLFLSENMDAGKNWLKACPKLNFKIMIKY